MFINIISIKDVLYIFFKFSIISKFPLFMFTTIRTFSVHY